MGNHSALWMRSASMCLRRGPSRSMSFGSFHRPSGSDIRPHASPQSPGQVSCHGTSLHDFISRQLVRRWQFRWPSGSTQISRACAVQRHVNDLERHECTVKYPTGLRSLTAVPLRPAQDAPAPDALPAAPQCTGARSLAEPEAFLAGGEHAEPCDFHVYPESQRL